jgi:hypothetical protein
MLVAALIVVGILIWIGATLLLDPWWKRRPEDLVDRLMPCQPGSVADEAEDWLDTCRPLD